MALLRYPGGKGKLRKEIIGRMDFGRMVEYREPFFGSGSIGIELIDRFRSMWINDIDCGISSLWTAVIRYPEELKRLVKLFKPSVEVFDKFKEDLIEGGNRDLVGDDVVEFGFKKLVIHQISYSGLGVKSGGPLGGRKQISKYGIGCRWSTDHVCKKVDMINKMFRDIVIMGDICSRLDFSDIIKVSGSGVLIYIDPPYYKKGGELYQYSFSEYDHIRLVRCLRDTEHRWYLSYDDCEEEATVSKKL